MDVKLSALCRTIQSFFKYQSSVGIEGYTRTAELDQFLSVRPVGFRSRQGRQEGPGRAGKSRPERSATNHIPNDQAHSDRIPAGNMGHIERDIFSCNGCGLAGRRRFSVPGRGGNRAKLFVVGGWLSVSGGEEKNRELLFGDQEDVMVSRMMGALGLQESEVYITNLVKCGCDRGTEVTQEHLLSCLPFLQRQIRLIQPEVMCTMGTAASQILLKSNRSISQLRGRFYPYKETGLEPIPLMATYHPTFLLKTVDMKQETWKDLQAIGRRLASR